MKLEAFSKSLKCEVDAACFREKLGEEKASVAAGGRVSYTGVNQPKRFATMATGGERLRVNHLTVTKCNAVVRPAGRQA